MKIGIVAAVPLELTHIVRGWERMPAPGRSVRVWRSIDADGDQLIAGCAGIGAESARRAFAALESTGPLDLVLSIGLAGATDPTWRIGQCAVLSEVIDTLTGERFALTDRARKLRIAALSRVADAHEKRRVFDTYGAVMVDMESATIARMAQQRGISMYCIKAVSDEASAALPDINPYLRDGQLRLVPFLGGVAMRPRHWGALLRLGRNSSLASKRLGETVGQFLLDKDWAHVNRRGAVEEQR